MSLVARLAAARTRERFSGFLAPLARTASPSDPGGIEELEGVHPYPPLQLPDLSQQRHDHRIPLRQGSQQLLTAQLPRIGHAFKLRIFQHPSQDHRNRRVYLKSDTATGLNGYLHLASNFSAACRKAVQPDMGKNKRYCGWNDSRDNFRLKWQMGREVVISCTAPTDATDNGPPDT